MTRLLARPRRLRSLLPALTRARGALALSAVLAGAVASGCGAEGSPTSVGQQRLDEKSMESLLTLEDLEEAGADTSRLSVEVEDVLLAAGAIEADQLEGVRSWHAMKVKRGKTGAVLIFTVIEMTTPEGASARLAQVESGLGFKAMSDPVGDASALLESSAGTGLTFVKERRVITLQTTVGDLAEPVIDRAGVERLARLISNRL